MSYFEKEATHDECCGKCIHHIGKDVDEVPCSFCKEHNGFVCAVCGTCSDFTVDPGTCFGAGLQDSIV
jgi:hypothetical protein